MLVSCQAYKSVSSKYNILYNGELFLDEGISQLKESYNENFWEIIPVLTENNITNTLPDYPSKNFLKSEEKAIKVIQKMGDDNNIDSEYINQAYLLLGKSRFYDKRYLSSIQALNYILKQNEKSKFWFEALFYRALIFINLEQYDSTISFVEKEQKKFKISNSEKSIIYQIIAEAYSKKNDLNKVISSLKYALSFSNNNENIRRLNFIIAQSYNELSEKDSTLLYLESSLNTKASKFEEIYLDAKLKLTLINEDLYDESFYKTELNRPRNFQSLAKIKYYYAANQYQKGNTAFASLLFKEALKLNQNDDKLNEKVYEQLYSLNLSDKKYLIANNYLDSLMNLLDNQSKKYFILSKKREKLNIVSELEKENNLIDSLFYLSTFNEEDLFEKLYLDKVNKTKIANESLAETRSKTNSIFYFNNNSAIASGLNQFKNVWGKRERVENWRLSKVNFIDIEKEQVESKFSNFNVDSDIDQLIKLIPYSKSRKDSLNKIKNSNFYKMGLYFFEYFNDVESSLENFNKINRELASELEYLQSQYYLYRIYNSKEFKNLKIANQIKTNIIQNYSSSSIAKTLSQDELQNRNKVNIESYIENLKLKVESNKIDYAVRSIDSVLSKSISRTNRFDLLIFKAELEAKEKGINSYINSLNELIEFYPELSQGLKEKLVFLDQLNTKKSMSINDSSFIVFFEIDMKFNVNTLELNEYNIDKYDSATNLLSFYGFKSILESKDFVNQLIKKNKILSNNKYFVISTPQYINMLIFKTLDELKK